MSHKYYAIEKTSGNILEVDLHTGEERLYSGEAPLIDLEKFTRIKLHNGEWAWVLKSIPLDQLTAVTGSRIPMAYSRFLADRICVEIAGGKTLAAVSRMEGMPLYQDLLRWRRDHPEFEEMLDIAISDRGEFYFDKIITTIEEAIADKDEVQLARLKTDIYKYAAKISNPRRFSETTKIDANIAIGAYKLETGIRRPGDPGFNKDETRALNESTLNSTAGEGYSSGIHIQSDKEGGDVS